MNTGPHHVGNKYERVEVGGSARAHLGDQYNTGPRYYIQTCSHHLPTPAGELIRDGDILPDQNCHYVVRHGAPGSARESAASMLNRVSEYDAPAEHWRRSSLRVPGTCQWIFKDPVFLRWQKSKEIMGLWCTGPVGCGKSILASSVIDHLRETKAANCVLVPHCYIESTSSIVQKAQDILCALAKQCLVALATLSGRWPSDLEQILRKATADSVSIYSMQKIQDLFEALLKKLPGTIFVVDGIDSLSENQILDFLGFVRCTYELFQLQGAKLVIISRKAIGKGIDISTQLPQSCCIALNHTNLKSDISTFVDVQMETFQSRRVLTSDNALLQRICATLKTSGQEMFLWIYLQLLNIWNPKLSKCEDDIISLLDSMPADLGETYKWCLRRISSNGDLYADVAIQAFRWVSQARRPLTSRQLREAVSLRHDRVLLTESAIVNSCVTEYCANLLIIDPTGHVCFTHPSVQNFLEERAHLDLEVSAYRLSPVLDNSFCGQICISYLVSIRRQRQLVAQSKTQIPADFNNKLVTSMPGIPRSVRGLVFKRTLPTDQAKPFTLVSPTRLSELAILQLHNYFLTFWLDHTITIAAGDRGYTDFESLCLACDAELWPIMLPNLDKSDFFKHLMRTAIYLNHVPLLRCVCKTLQASDTRLYRALLRGDLIDSGIRPQHLAAALGHLPCVAYLIESDAVEIDACDEEGKTALYWAAENGHMQVVRLISAHSPASMIKCKKISLNELPTLNSWLASTALMHLSLPATLARRSTPDCCYQFISDNTRNDVSLVNDDRVWSQTFFAACLHGHIALARRLVDEHAVDFSFFQAFAFPGFQQIVKGAAIEFAALRESPKLLCALLKVGAAFNSSLFQEIRRRSLWDMYILLCCLAPGAKDDDVPLKDGEVLALLKLGLTDRIFESLRTTIHADDLDKEFRVGRHSARIWSLVVLASLWPTNLNSSFRKWRDLTRIAIPSMRWSSMVGVDTIMSISKLYLTTPDDILIQLILEISLTDTLVLEFVLKLGELRKSCRADIACWAYHWGVSFVTPFSQPPYSNSWPWRRGEDLYHTPEGFWKEVKGDLAPLSSNHLAVEVLRPYVVFRHAAVVAEHRHPNFRSRWSIVAIYNVACECLRIHCKLKRWPSIPISQKFGSLCDAHSDGVFDLNFPIGYTKISTGKWVIKPFIISALYRWNWRLRRRKKMPYSDADWHYCPALCARAKVRESEDLYN